MRFYWPEGPTEMIMEMGMQVRGLQQKGLRPMTVTFEPLEICEYLRKYGEERLNAYLFLCHCATRK